MTAPELDGVAEALALHVGTPRKTLFDDTAPEGWGWYCDCGARIAENVRPEEARLAHFRHVAEVIAASGVVVPVAEVREELLPLRRFMEANAVTMRARGRTDEERDWLDALALLARLAGDAPVVHDTGGEATKANPEPGTEPDTGHSPT